MLPTATSPASLTLRERARLANILARLASPYEGERAAAALLACAFVERHGLTWSDLVLMSQAQEVQPALPEAPQDRRHGRGRAWRGYCRRRQQPFGTALSCYA